MTLMTLVSRQSKKIYLLRRYVKLISCNISFVEYYYTNDTIANL